MSLILKVALACFFMATVSLLTGIVGFSIASTLDVAVKQLSEDELPMFEELSHLTTVHD